MTERELTIKDFIYPSLIILCGLFAMIFIEGRVAFISGILIVLFGTLLTILLSQGFEKQKKNE